MRVDAYQFKEMKRLINLIEKMKGLADRHYDLPLPSTAEKWLNSGAIPAGKYMAKVFMLSLYPVPGFPIRRYELAELVAKVLQERHQANNDWACGYHPRGNVCLFIKPWGTSMITQKRVWFRPDPDDMAIIRRLDAAYRV